jgi:nucleotide-binding universal stress UspA family protein
MSTDSRASTILVAVDGSPESDAAVAWAARESSIRSAPVTLMHVISPVLASWPIETMFNPPAWYENSARHIVEHAEKTFQSSWAGTTPADVHTAISNGGIVPVLAKASEDAQMVVVGSRGLGTVKGTLLGSVSSGLLHHAHCPVAIIRADQAEVLTDAPVLVGIDGSPGSESATALAFDEASHRGVSVIALHAWSDFGVYIADESGWHRYQREADEMVAERLSEWQQRYPDVDVRRDVVCDEPAHRLIEEAQRAQLIVLGSRGRGGFAGMLLGSTSSAVVQTASVPVIVVRR